VLVRRLGALEVLARTDLVIFDKTGTLTRDALVLQGLRLRAGATRAQVLAQAAALARHSLHPVSRAVQATAETDAVVPWLSEQVQERAGAGLTGQVRSAADGAWQTLRLGSAAHCGAPIQQVPGPHAVLSDAQGWLATFEFGEDLRPDAQATVAALQAAGIEVRILSGDAPEAVARVAQQLGIARAQGGCTPQDKLEALRQARQDGRQAVVVGDGLNDGPALAGAQASFAFGRAVPLAQSRADFVVLGEQLARVEEAIRLARRTLRIVRQNLGWAVAYNAVCVPLAVAGWMPAWLAGLGMAASSLLVVVNALRLAPGWRGEESV
jgi:Cu2+-exporting ATPase